MSFKIKSTVETSNNWAILALSAHRLDIRDCRCSASVNRALNDSLLAFTCSSNGSLENRPKVRERKRMNKGMYHITSPNTLEKVMLSREALMTADDLDIAMRERAISAKNNSNRMGRAQMSRRCGSRVTPTHVSRMGASSISWPRVVGSHHHHPWPRIDGQRLESAATITITAVIVHGLESVARGFRMGSRHHHHAHRHLLSWTRM